MQLAASQAWETGLFQVPFFPGGFPCWIFWAFFTLGCLLQWLVLKKARRAAWAVPATLIFGLLAGELGCQTITGWDLLLPLFGWRLCLSMLLGAAAAWLADAWKQKKKEADR